MWRAPVCAAAEDERPCAQTRAAGTAAAAAPHAAAAAAAGGFFAPTLVGVGAEGERWGCAAGRDHAFLRWGEPVCAPAGAAAGTDCHAALTIGTLSDAGICSSSSASSACGARKCGSLRRLASDSATACD